MTLQARTERFDRALATLRDAPALAVPTHRPKVLTAATALMRDAEGMRALYDRIEDVLDANLLHDTPWQHPERLVPSLVGGTLRAGGEVGLLETISELRMLALASGHLRHEKVTTDQARAFLQEVMVLDLDLAFPSGSEAERDVPPAVAERAQALFALILEHVPLDGVKDTLAREVRMIMRQRPIVTVRARTLLTFARDRFGVTTDPTDAATDAATDADRILAEHLAAIDGPSPLSRRHADPASYARALEAADDDALRAEAETLGASMRETGLVAKQHPMLLRHVADRPELLALALSLNEGGLQQLRDHHELVASLIRSALHPDTEQAVAGLAEVLNGGLLARPPVRAALQRLPDLELHPTVHENIRRSVHSDLPPGTVLLADALSMLGQPLGISQGWSPTCQSARGLALWSQYAPGKLLDMVITVAKSDRLEMRFESAVLDSSILPAGLALEKIDLSLDAVSTVLVPHLDRIYNEMMKRAALRADDGHKWVNPAMYGHWIPTGFRSAFDPVTQSIAAYDAFVRTFYAAFHPAWNGGHQLAYPSPVGLFVTSASGSLLGFHAVSLLRVARHVPDAADEVATERTAVSGAAGAAGRAAADDAVAAANADPEPDPDGMRAYFLNPNAEGRQDWGHGVEPTVFGHGERPGESSLPFRQFLSRLYAYHYNPTDLGELEAVPADEVARVSRAARSTWGEAYFWTEAVLAG
ncbi:MAG: hypothetical protein WD336_02380 [Trueperaceae bacterium]